MKKKTMVMICALGMTLGFAGCGNSKSDNTDSAPAATTETQTETEAKTEAPKGTTGNWGNYEEVFIPDGMKIIGGSQIDKEDPNSFWIQREDNALNYYLFGVSTEEQCQKDVESTRNYNKESNPQDVTLKTGDYEWKGVSYKYGGTTDVSQIYAKIGDKVVMVRIGGFAYDDDSTKAILGSLKLKKE